MKSDYRIRARKFLKSIFSLIQYNMYEPYEVESTLSKYFYNSNRVIHVKWGATRIAIITSDYVIKWDYADAETIIEFGGISSEIKFYAQAVNDGYGYLFAEATPFEYRGHVFSIMPRIGRIGFVNHNYKQLSDCLSTKELNYIRENIYDMHCDNWGIKHQQAIIVDYASNSLLY